LSIPGTLLTGLTKVALWFDLLSIDKNKTANIIIAKKANPIFYKMDADKEQKAKEREERKQKMFLEKVKTDIFDKYDENKDGVLQKAELKQYVNDVCKRTEMPPFGDQFFDQLFRSCDDDKNHTIDFDEFIKHFGQFCTK